MSARWLAEIDEAAAVAIDGRDTVLGELGRLDYAWQDLLSAKRVRQMVAALNAAIAMRGVNQYGDWSAFDAAISDLDAETDAALDKLGAAG